MDLVLLRIMGMATTEQVLAPAHDAASTPSAAAVVLTPTAEQVAESALNQEELAEEALNLVPAAARLPVELDVSIVVHEFRVRNLLALEPGQVVETHWSHGQDLPLAARRVQLAWAEFEVVDAMLAVRITHLA